MFNVFYHGTHMFMCFEKIIGRGHCQWSWWNGFSRKQVLIPCTNQCVTRVLKVLKVCSLADSVSVLWLYLIGELQRDSDCWNTSGIFPLGPANSVYKRFSSYELGFCLPIIFLYSNHTIGTTQSVWTVGLIGYQEDPWRHLSEPSFMLC